MQALKPTSRAFCTFMRDQSAQLIYGGNRPGDRQVYRETQLRLLRVNHTFEFNIRGLSRVVVHEEPGPSYSILSKFDSPEDRSHFRDKFYITQGDRFGNSMMNGDALLQDSSSPGYWHGAYLIPRGIPNPHTLTSALTFFQKFGGGARTLIETHWVKQLEIPG